MKLTFDIGKTLLYAISEKNIINFDSHSPALISMGLILSMDQYNRRFYGHAIHEIFYPEWACFNLGNHYYQLNQIEDNVYKQLLSYFLNDLGCLLPNKCEDFILGLSHNGNFGEDMIQKCVMGAF